MTDYDSNTGNNEKTLDLRGESCPVPEMTASKELQKINKGKLIILTDHAPAIEVTLPSLCKSLGLNYEIKNKGDYVEFIIYKESTESKEEEDSISFSKSITIDSENDIVDKLTDPHFLMSFVPQIKAIEQIQPGNFILHIKWILNFETPLYLNYQKTPRGGLIYYTAYEKLPMMRIRFGWKIIINKTVKENIIDITEWYSGPFKSFASTAIKKHLSKAEEILPTILAKT
ncbi:sulfurtransferase TusA family protein [Acidianus manzaensis]|uniref:Oxidoreductase n=1 Tax=Acidianus manzaensis TaxID=282676 RepID=A0A1W6K2X2_9CREN|nr:sulfurtransferase TusA family protein [Acidianus manzaensis]ARM76866.1 oxidoreductase [Acidianus manzaensis]